MGKYVGGRNWPLSVAWTSTSHSGYPKLFHRSTVSTKTSFRFFKDVRCKLLAFSNSALSILHLFSLLLRFFLKLGYLQSNCANRNMSIRTPEMPNMHVARVARETSANFSATVVSWRAGHRQPRHPQIVSGAHSPRESSGHRLTCSRMMYSSIWDKVDALESLEPSHGIHPD